VGVGSGVRGGSAVGGGVLDAAATWLAEGGVGANAPPANRVPTKKATPVANTMRPRMRARFARRGRAGGAADTNVDAPGGDGR
jgi:hypothetical protein